jgi:hypothetical protein
MIPIASHPGYSADPRGLIFSTRGRKPVCLPRYLDAAGFWCCTLTSQTGERMLFVRVHDLIADAYLAPQPPGMFAAHRGPRWNNAPGNLRWTHEQPPPRGYGLDAAEESRLIALIDRGESVPVIMAATGLPLSAVNAYRAALAPEPQDGRGRPKIDPAVDRRIAGLLAEGWSTEAVAREVGVSPRLVRYRKAALAGSRP